MSGVDPYARLAGVYDEIVVDPCHGRWAAFLHELWAADRTGFAPSSTCAAAPASWPPS